jgi:thiamine pyrophosphokinase
MFKMTWKCQKTGEEEEMSRGVLLIGGAGPDSSFINNVIEPDDLICAADSGLDAAIAAGIRPDGIVGDMDSISDKTLLDRFPADSVDIYPCDKDDSDTEIGIAWLRARGCRHLTIIGGGEGRLDHTLALVSLFGGTDPPGIWYTARETIQSIEGTVEIRGEAGSPISFCTTGTGPWYSSSRGLQWELDDVVWKLGTVSLSNRLTGKSAEIEVGQGRLLMIRELFDVKRRK